jgi:putative redox protein
MWMQEPLREEAARMVKITTTYEGGLRCAAVHGPSGTTLLTDAPVDNHGKGESFSPTDLVATGLGACMMTIMGIVAQRHAIDLTGMRAETLKEMTVQAPRRIASLRTRLTIPLPADHPQRQLLEQAAHTCPVHKSLHPDIDAAIEFIWAGFGAAKPS